MRKVDDVSDWSEVGQLQCLQICEISFLRFFYCGRLKMTSDPDLHVDTRCCHQSRGPNGRLQIL